MCKYSIDSLGDVGHWGYDIPKPTAELLTAVPQQHIDFVSDDYHNRDIYTAAGTVTTTAWQTLPLTAARFPCISLQTTNQGVSLEGGFWKLTMFGVSTGDASVRIITAAGSIDRTVDIQSGQFDASRAIFIPGQTSFRIEGKKRGVLSTSTIELNVTLLIEQL